MSAQDSNIDTSRIAPQAITLRYLGATAGVSLCTLLVELLHLDRSPVNLPMFYLLVVMVSALFWGRGPAIWASLISFLSINWFFITPRYTFTVKESSEWFSLCMFLFTAGVTGQLTAMLKARALESRRRQQEMAVLSDAGWAVVSQLDTRSALTEVVRQMSKVVDLDSAVIVATDDGADRIAVTYPDSYGVKLKDLESDEWCENGGMILEIEMNQKRLGSVYLRLAKRASLTSEQGQIVNSLVNHSAVILQRHGLMKIESHAVALADADRLKTALLSMVSHDFRSPLTSIKACVSTLLGEGQPLEQETQRELFQAIEQETDRLNLLVGNVLDLSRLEADAWRPKLELTPVTELVGMVLDSFAPDSNRRIIVNLDPNLNDVLVDSAQMTQVLRNLLENALKYSASDSSVEISTKIEDYNAFIKVRDSGRGLADNEKEKIFEPFYRGAGLEESSIPGLGIGLAVCKGLVEAHNGTLTAENNENGGAIFIIMLPLDSKYKTVQK